MCCMPDSSFCNKSEAAIAVHIRTMPPPFKYKHYFFSTKMTHLHKMLLAAGLIFPLGSMAQTYIGYINDDVEINKSAGIGFSTTENAYGAAIHIPASKAASLAGKHVSGVRTMLSTRKVSNMKIFLTKELGGTPVAEASVSIPNNYRAGNYIDLNFSSPVELDGSEFYIGYTLSLTEANGGKPSLYDNTYDFAEGTSWAYADGSWIDVSTKGYGAPALKFIVDGASSVADVVVKPFSTSNYYKASNSYELLGELYNFGNTPITSLTFTTQVGDEAPVTHEYKDLKVNPNTSYQFNLDNVKPESVGNMKLSVNVSSVNGTADADASDNAQDSNIYVYPSDMKKRILIEKFTGQACGNCPEGDVAINAAVKGREDDFVVVAHHTYLTGTNGDIFAVNESFSLGSWFFNSNNSYAPAGMVNRAPYASGLSTVVFGNGGGGLAEGLTPGIILQDKTEPYISVGLNNNFDETTRKGTVEVVMHTYRLPSTTSETLKHTLNVYLTQDGVVGYQSGGGSYYTHNHALRTCLTGAWGEVIELNEGETLTKTYEYEIPDSIVSSYSNAKLLAVPANMNVVAFVGDITKSPLTCVVYNANTIPVTTSGATEGVDNATVAAERAYAFVNGNQLYVNGSYRKAEVFDLSGKQVGILTGTGAVQLGKGVYVVRVDGQSSKVVVK